MKKYNAYWLPTRRSRKCTRVEIFAENRTRAIQHARARMQEATAGQGVLINVLEYMEGKP